MLPPLSPFHLSPSTFGPYNQKPGVHIATRLSVCSPHLFPLPWSLPPILPSPHLPLYPFDPPHPCPPSPLVRRRSRTATARSCTWSAARRSTPYDTWRSWSCVSAWKGEWGQGKQGKGRSCSEAAPSACSAEQQLKQAAPAACYAHAHLACFALPRRANNAASVRLCPSHLHPVPGSSHPLPPTPLPPQACRT